MTIAVAQSQFFKNQMWKVFNVLRNEVSASDYHIVLLLLSLYEEGGLRQLKDVPLEERKRSYNQLVEENLLAHNETLEDLYDQVYLNIIERISQVSFYKLTEALFEIEEDILRKNYVEYFEELLSLIIENLGKYDGEFRTPTEISQFAFELVELPENARIYNPFAGLATYATFLSSSQKYFGQEINLTTYASAILRLFVHDKWQSSALLQGDSIFDWNPNCVDVINQITHSHYRTGEKAKYDLVIANPPFAVKLQEVITGKFGIIKNAESFLIEKGIGSLADNGKLVSLVSNVRLSSGGAELGLRRYLVDEDILETVVSFPGALLQNTSIPFSIIVINKDKKLKDAVKFVDASSFITREKRNWTFDGEQLLEDIHSNIENEAIKIVSNRRIEQEDFNFSVSRYFVEETSGIAIGELGEILSTSTPVEKVGHLISNQWLKTDSLNYLIPNNFVPYEQLPKFCRQITESCFLISTTGGKLKLGFFNYEGIPFYISPDIFPFKLVTQLVTQEYFVYQLLSKSILEQLRAYKSGSAIQRVIKADFLRLKLDIPSIENLKESLLHQEAVLEGVRNAYIRVHENELENERQLLGLKEEATRNFQSMKHTFRQYLSSLKSNTLGTKKFLELN